MNITISFWFFVAFLVTAGLMKLRMLPNRPVYHLILSALFSTVVGFMIPAFVYVDILVAFVLFLIVDFIYYRRQKKQ